MFIVQEAPVALMLTGSSLVLAIFATILNAVFAFSLRSSVPAIQLLACVAFAINILTVCGLIFIVSRYIPKIKEGSTGWSTALCWRFLAITIATASMAALLSSFTLIWTVARMADLPEHIAGQSSRGILIAWFALWGVSLALQLGAFAFVAWWTKKALYNRSLAAMDLDFGVVSPEMRHNPSQPRPASESFRSHDPTLTSAPQTPTTIGFSGPFRLSQSGGKAGPTSSRTRLVHSMSFTRDSAKSSLDYPTGETNSVDHPFDKWDTSGVAGDVRTTLRSAPPVTRSGLETIPGSRPESPAKTLDGPFLPDSPIAASSDAATAVEICEHSSSPRVSISSPPSSPPNFSRPTSRQINQPRINHTINGPILEPPLENIIHPLFRTSSPHPAPVAAAGTMVTASPLAGQSITPKTLTRMRSVSMPQQPSPMKEPELAPPMPDSDSGTPGAGSPGPSIEDDEELPPVIPGFILSAGQRASFVEYGKRKSLRSRSASFH